MFILQTIYFSLTWLAYYIFVGLYFTDFEWQIKTWKRLYILIQFADLFSFRQKCSFLAQLKSLREIQCDVCSTFSYLCKLWIQIYTFLIPKSLQPDILNRNYFIQQNLLCLCIREPSNADDIGLQRHRD